MFEMTQARKQDLENQGEEEEEDGEEEERKKMRRGDIELADYEEEQKRDGYVAEMEEAVEEMRSREVGVETSRTPRNRNFLETNSVSLKRSSQLVRSDALSPTSITRHLVMENEEMKRGIEEVGEVETEKRSRNNGNPGVSREQRETAGNSRESRDCQTNLRETMREPACPRDGTGGRRKSCTTQSLDASSAVPPTLETLPVRLMTKQERFSCS